MSSDCSQPYSAAQKRSLKLADVSASQLPETAGNASKIWSKVKLHSVDSVDHLVLLFSSQYVAKNNSELHQRAIPKRVPVLTVLDERDDSVERQVQRIPTLGPASQQDDVASEAQPEVSTVKHTSQDVVAQKDPVSSTGSMRDETPHVHVETDEAKEARLDRRWKQLKVDVVDLPDVYARLAKIKLTGRVQSRDASSDMMSKL